MIMMMVVANTIPTSEFTNVVELAEDSNTESIIRFIYTDISIMLT